MFIHQRKLFNHVLTLNVIFQDLNLHVHLSIIQTFKFYGRMLNMKNEKIMERAKELTQLLELPSNNRLVDSLR